MNCRQTYTWRTDAASGEIEASNADAVFAQLIAENEWEANDARILADGAFLRVWDEDMIPVISLGDA